MTRFFYTLDESRTMVLKQDDMELLERKFAMYVILAVEKHPMSTKTEIMRLDNGNEKTKFNRIQELIAAGLIHHVETETGATRIDLTPEGKAIAAKLKTLRLALIKSTRNNQDPDDTE